MKRKIFCFVIFALILFGLLTLKKQNVVEAKGKKLKITSGKDISLIVGNEKTLKANQKAIWKSKNKNINIITNKKALKVKIKAKKPGKGIIVAKKGKQKAIINITVKNKLSSESKEDAKYVKVDIYLQSLKKLVLTYKNLTKHELVYGKEYELQKFKNNKWVNVPSQPDSFKRKDIALAIGAGESMKDTVDLKSCFGNLKPGHYKIIKKMITDDDYDPQRITVASEFIIEKKRKN